jgi:hypothetical protein
MRIQKASALHVMSILTYKDLLVHKRWYCIRMMSWAFRFTTLMGFTSDLQRLERRTLRRVAERTGYVTNKDESHGSYLPVRMEYSTCSEIVLTGLL